MYTFFSRYSRRESKLAWNGYFQNFPRRRAHKFPEFKPGIMQHHLWANITLTVSEALIYKGRGQIHLELVSDKWRTEKAAFLRLFPTADVDQDQRIQGGESRLWHAVVVVDCFYIALFSAHYRADSLHSHVIVHEWLDFFYSAFLNIHWNGVLTALAWLVPHETAAISAGSVYTIQPCTMSLHAKPHS